MGAMTNSAEKIRQVLEKNKKRFPYLYNNAIDSNSHDGLDVDLVTFWHQDLTANLLDAIIEEMEIVEREVTKKCIATMDKDPYDHAYYVGKADAIHDICKTLEEARTSLTTTL